MSVLGQLQTFYDIETSDDDSQYTEVIEESLAYEIETELSQAVFVEHTYGAGRFILSGCTIFLSSTLSMLYSK